MGNIFTGLELIRRISGGGASTSGSTSDGAAAEEATSDKADRACFGMTFPLLTKADGTKMGKSASGAVWLAAGARTAPAWWQVRVQLLVNTHDEEHPPGRGRLLRLSSASPSVVILQRHNC